jgi:hypothetical protein
MIVRTQDSDELVLVPQTDHSKLVGQIAAHWGNGDFTEVKPFASVVRAATSHDFGWIRYETNPVFNTDTGATLHYLDVPNTGPHLQMFSQTSQWLSDVDPYSALIFDMHRTGLWRRRYSVIDHPKAYLHRTDRPSMTITPEIEAMLVEGEASQAKVRSQFDENAVWTNYRLMQVWDLIGLYFCCHEPDDLYITPVPQSYADARTEGVRIMLKPVAKHEVEFTPFPFRKRGIKIFLSTKRLPKRKYPNSDEFLRAYFQAKTELLTFTLV